MRLEQDPGIDIWETILDKLKKVVNAQSFQTWFAPTRLAGYERGVLLVEGPNSFFIDWLAEHHIDKITEAASEVLGEKVVIEFSSPSPRRTVRAEKPVERSVLVREPVILPNSVQLNSRYTFQEFVVGNENLLAHAAALAVAEKPAQTYNPLFIYGGPGLGKTHLLQAIGHFVLEEHPGMRISYVSTESFMNELIRSIRNGETFEFKERYRNIDILLIDDIHFLAGKERTQEEFFYTFNALHNASKQIVCTSDRPPKEIPSLQDRLTSRFEWGLITDIQPPDLETRVAILRKKVEKEIMPIPESVIFLIAENVRGNTRELEGSLVKILACASLTNQDINVDMAGEVLKVFISGAEKKKISIKSIQRAVAAEFDIPVHTLSAKTRMSRVVAARQVAIFLSRELTSLSLVQIGKGFGGRDHSTVLHSIKKIETSISVDPSLERQISALRKDLET
ncbi:MAG: chromosomal replication initiator protein DnaA [Candidatus Krumholzibacteriota bacterium]|nr:chromosomal replication initiator protein DnaA [Candidatus Krumholzibacteriota bacterium]